MIGAHAPVGVETAICSANRVPHAGKAQLRRNVGWNAAWGPPTPSPVTRLRSAFRDRDGVLHTVDSANGGFDQDVRVRDLS